MKKPDFVPDESSKSCMGCNGAFSFFLRRHHCRGCGRLFCGTCAAQYAAMPDGWGYRGRQRVCDACFVRLGGGDTGNAAGLPEKVTLEIQLFGARNLLAADFGLISPKSDPYAVLEVFSSRSVEAAGTAGSGECALAEGAKPRARFVSKTIKKTLSPTWNESFSVTLDEMWPDDVLLLTVFDYDRRGKDDSLGAAALPLRSLPIDQETVRMFKLFGGSCGENVKKALGKAMSKLTRLVAKKAVGATVSHAGGGAMGGKLASKAVGSAMDLRAGGQSDADANHGLVCMGLKLVPVVESDAAAAALAAKRAKAPKPKKGGAYECWVGAICAGNLNATDMGVHPSSDPYCAVSIGREMRVTSFIKKSLNPNWQQLLVLPVKDYDPKMYVHVQVKDHDWIGKDDSLGDGRIDLDGFKPPLCLGQTRVVMVQLEGGDVGENLMELARESSRKLESAAMKAAVRETGGSGASKVAGVLLDHHGKPKKVNHGVVALSVTLVDAGTPIPPSMQPMLQGNKKVKAKQLTEAELRLTMNPKELRQLESDEKKAAKKAEKDAKEKDAKKDSSKSNPKVKSPRKK